MPTIAESKKGASRGVRREDREGREGAGHGEVLAAVEARDRRGELDRRRGESVRRRPDRDRGERGRIGGRVPVHGEPRYPERAVRAEDGADHGRGYGVDRRAGDRAPGGDDRRRRGRRRRRGSDEGRRAVDGGGREPRARGG